MSKRNIKPLGTFEPRQQRCQGNLFDRSTISDHRFLLSAGSVIVCVNDLTTVPVTSALFSRLCRSKFANFKPAARSTCIVARANIEAEGAGSESNARQRLAMQIGPMQPLDIFSRSTFPRTCATYVRVHLPDRQERHFHNRYHLSFDVSRTSE